MTRTKSTVSSCLSGDNATMDLERIILALDEARLKLLMQRLATNPEFKSLIIGIAEEPFRDDD